MEESISIKPMAIKIAMITDLPAPGEAVDGGVEAVSSYLVEELVRVPEVQLHVITFRTTLDKAETHVRSNYVQYLIPFGSFGTLTGFALDQARLGKCLSRIQPDIVHSQGAGHYGILASRCGIPSVMTIHGIQSQEATYQTTLRQRLRTRFQGWLAARYCIRRAEHTILISPYVADHFGNSLAGKRYCIPNPVSAQFFDVVRREEPGRILFLGRLYALKGVKELVLAVAKLPRVDNVRIILGGSVADEKYVNEVRKLARQLDIEQCLRIPGILSNAEVLNELSRCACLVLPSFQETAPMVIQEAMASGVPVIASNICGIPYQVVDGVTGFLVPPGDIDALAGRLNLILSDSALCRSLGSEARKKALSEYRAERIAAKTLDVYREILG